MTTKTKRTGRQLLQTTIAAAMAFTMLAAPFTSTNTAYAQADSKGSPTQAASALAAQTKQDVKTNIQYDIQAKLNTDDMTISGKQTVKYRNTSSDKLNDVVFRLFADAHRSKETQPSMFARSNEEIAQENPDKKPEDFLGGIDIISVKDTATGRTLATKNEKQALTVQLEKALNQDEEVALELEYKTKIPFGSQRLSYQKDIINGAHWFPVMSVYDEKTHTWNKTPYSTKFETDYYEVADYNVNMNVPEKLQVVMPGQMSEQPAEAGRKVVSTKSDKTRELVFFSSEKFHKASKTKNGLTVEYVYYNDNNDPAKTAVINKYIDQAFKAIEFFSDKFGKYEYPEFRIVESHVEGVAVEFSRVIQMGLVDANAAPEKKTAFVHEIAHQWFHSIIGNDSETESFLDEGFADFAMSYFFNEQGSKLSGFDDVRSDIYPLDIAINSTNDNAGESPDALFYKRGRLAIYELYRTVGQEKFDAFMKEYFNRYAYRNATVDGLLQTIEDQFGKAVRDRMDDNLNKPNFELKPEYGMTEAEQAEFMRLGMVEMYDGVEQGYPDLSKETMFKIMSKALHGEPLTIVYSNPVSKAAKEQQEMIFSGIQNMLSMTGMKADIMSERQAIKKNMETTLAKSNVIVIGNPKHNTFIQALKPAIVAKAEQAGFPWKEVMNKPGLHGAYGVTHPYNKDRMVVHYFWTDDHVNEKAAAGFLPLAGMKTLMVTNNFYQYFIQKADGSIYKEKFVDNPISKLFQTEE
ncbi:M1 family metallopeptidase [Paenibacillus sp. OSY-SE]|uniref:M1 family metallopeptidase n=1 Tax=Paenibacillus sp. OSY-SE TaxID=1196323 RepID=UPI0002ED5471|nr:M1 family metallopeptidase [Paenibacillus sp. OSY-SE]